MKNKTNKRAFTIVELVIVIAIVAIMAAVLIPTFSSLVKKANISSDTQLIRNLNTALVIDKASGNEHPTMTDALKTAEESGFLVDVIDAKVSENKILWDRKNDLFCYLEEGKVVPTYHPDFTPSEDVKSVELWEIVSVVPSLDDQKYSLYYVGTETNVTVKVGFDDGSENGVGNVIYQSGAEKQTVVIRTKSFSTVVEINETKGDTINHYGDAGKLITTSLSTNSYHEYGKLSFAVVSNGRVVVENKGVIEVAFVTSAEAYLQEKDSGVINAAYASTAEVKTASETADATNGEKKQLSYDNSKTVEQNKEIAENAGNAANENAVEGENVEKEMNNNQNAVALVKVGTTYNAYNSLADAVKDADDGSTINVVRDSELSGTLNLSDKKLSIVGYGSTKPILVCNIEIKHTSGNHSINFENIQFEAKEIDKSLIFDKSKCSSKEDVNKLEINNCKFLLKKETTDTKGVVVVASEFNKASGTQLTVTNSRFETESYSQANKSGNYTVAINTSAGGTDSMYNNSVYSYEKHVINNNEILGNFGYAYIGGYTEFNNNLVDQKYYNGNTLKTNGSRAFQFRGSTNENVNGAQFNVEINNNIFKNEKQLFKLYYLDETEAANDWLFELSSNNNNFENIGSLGEAGDNSASILTKLAIKWSEITWTGINESNLNVAMDKMKMELEGTLETNYITLSNGSQVMTYTQAINPADNKRTGYSLFDVAGNRYWYFCTFNGNINYFLKHKTNELYVAILGGGAKCETLQLKNLDSEPDWINITSHDDKNKYKYYDGNTESTVAAIYKSNFTISNFMISENDSIGLYNATATMTENKINLTASVGKSSNDINMFISSIGSYNKLVITTNDSYSASNDTLVVVVPGEIGQLTINGVYETIIDTNISNVNVYSRQKLTITENNEVKGMVKINGENAIGSTMENRGKINKLYVFAKTDVTNNGHITTLMFGNNNPGGIVEKFETVKNAYGSTITNNGTIMSTISITKITLTNNQNSSIDGLTISWLNVNGGIEKAEGSIIVNNGNMCNIANGNINLYVKCTFTNEGTIGIEGRESHNDSNSKDIGGCINIGYWGNSDIHDGILLTNNGTIYAGARHNGGHQQYTIWVFGVKSGYGTKSPTIIVNNTGSIYGKNWITNYDFPAVHNVQVDYNN